MRNACNLYLTKRESFTTNIMKAFITELIGGTFLFALIAILWVIIPIAFN